MLRFAVITDIHYGFDKGYRLGSKAPKAMKEFTEAVNDYSPDFVIDLGDRISAKDKKNDKKNLKALKKHFNKIAAPVYFVIGNNDRRVLSRKENEKIIKCPQTESYSKDVNGYRLLFWNPNVNTDAKTGLYLTSKDITWLKNELNSTNKSVILFTHIPLDNTNQDNIDSAAWDKGRNKSYYPQVNIVRKVIEEAGNVVLCMAGHKHTNRHRQYGKTHFIVHQSFVQSETRERKAARKAYSFVEIDGNTIRIKGHGYKQPSHELKINEKNTPDFKI
jgi:Icc-related predicted phosphoesterase